MIRPLTFRHPAFGVSDTDVKSFLQYATLLRAAGPDPVRPEWAHSLWIHDDEYRPLPFDHDIPTSFWDAWATVIPSLTSLREMCLLILLAPPAFAPIALCHGATLKKLGMSLHSHDLLPAIPLLGHFQALEELRLELPKLEEPSATSSRVRIELDLPSLRSFEIAAWRFHRSSLALLDKANLPQLQILRFYKVRPEALGLAGLVRRHGANLKHVELGEFSVNTTTDLFPYTPALVTLLIPSKMRVKEQLRGLPVSVTKVLLSGHMHNHATFLDYTDLLKGLTIAVRGMLSYRPPPEFHLVYGQNGLVYAKGKKRLWQEAWDALDQPGQPKEQPVLMIFLAAARPLLALDVVLVDEDGVSLQHVVKGVERLLEP